ncbi:superoxide dismutase family protein [Aequorivita lipolytica]|uniref:Superoxide dismutase [Cu-Zn] n=1 Tax=Aequorivita lipolytica TaxID=153267 RepID=A0A5C6YLY2_9FLAO|nr:superoxide dismutase family protein [Aequorivita lipolytica]TXD68565.1 superoxide dismutase family protein [Aequorivita lipolytica]SRX53285.1 Superoxide dismutase-like protein YojM [Aequorivita lipolytica]
MKKLGILIAALAITVFVGCKNEKKDMDEMDGMNDSILMDSSADQMKEAAKTLSVAMESKSGSSAQGEAYFSEENGTVTMDAKFFGLKPGTHAIHLHEKADCSAADGTSAGGHWNPTLQKHGKWGDTEGYHKGDIGNFEVDADGNGAISMQTDEWCIGCGDENKDITGKSVIVHEGQDDFVSQPSGDAGSRVACGGIIE